MTEMASVSKPQLAQQEINLDSLAAYLRSRLPERKAMGPGALSRLIQQLVAAGYKTIADVDALLERAAEAVHAIEKDRPPTLPGPLHDTGVVRVSLWLANEEAAAEALKDTPTQLHEIARYRKLLRK